MAIAQDKGVFRGIVKDVEGQPMPGATVVIPELQVGALSNASGLFNINNVPAGEYVVKAIAPEMDTLEYALDMPEGGNVKADLMLRRQVVTDVIEVVGTQAGKIETNKVDAAITSIDADEISYVPTLGMSDLGVYLQVLPGVVHTGDQGGQLFVAGGRPSKTSSCSMAPLSTTLFIASGCFRSSIPIFCARSMSIPAVSRRAMAAA